MSHPGRDVEVITGMGDGMVLQLLACPQFGFVTADEIEGRFVSFVDVRLDAAPGEIVTESSQSV